MQPYLQIDSVVKRYGKTLALNNIQLSVARGEFVCFLGPSGCGKTTLLRAIAGLDPQSTGRILLDRRDISREPPERRGFGIVFQSYALFPNLTVADNIGYGLVSQGLDKAACSARVIELLQQIGLSDFASKYPGQLSGGQQQRIALARALAPRPALLLLDEPLSALDAKVRGSLRTEIKRLQRELGVTTVMVTHDQEEALTMADRIVVMNHGVIEQIGTPGEIYERPASRFVADFIGAMNFVAARVIGPDRIAIGPQEIVLGAPLSQLVGANVTAAVRPEHVRVLPADSREGLPATLALREFLGSHIRVWLTLAHGGSAQAMLSPDDAASLPANEGAEVRVQLPPSRMQVFDTAA